MMNPKKQLVELVGKKDAERYVEIVKSILKSEKESELKLVNK